MVLEHRHTPAMGMGLRQDNSFGQDINQTWSTSQVMENRKRGNHTETRERRLQQSEELQGHFSVELPGESR
jgi:hypothetical protein